ncbi:sigma-54-dependent Fis family transcriptional regulator [Candidatus Poribacteria bacterium]|nr:sigma-54-dependent Fis family transcriptional regulator [Candidatus Poribacteria bacterium]MYK20647.1 sigma-54-dependent Fis family transcriptional regulator [Candidatus Poribacteria bacterium]
MKTILIIAKNEITYPELEKFLNNKGYSPIIANGIETGLSSIASKDLNVVLMDAEFGIKGLETIQRKHSKVIIVVIGVDKEMSDDKDSMAVADFIAGGAFEAVASPIDMDSVKSAIESAFRRLSPREELFPETIREGEPTKYRLVGNSKVMLDLQKQIGAAARNKNTVLIEGETGTGKGLVARLIHKKSDRKDESFVSVNCGALPSELLEGEFFGHVKGAFTGAIADKPGKFEQANGGTLFLDEVGNMSPDCQMKLLSALQDEEITRLGGTKPIEVDVRVIAATNQKLDELVQKAKFREDLYYRFKVIQFQLSPLGERKEDIPLFISHFLQLIQHEQRDKSIRGVSKETKELLENYEWPGNVRQLEHCLRQAVVNAKGEAILPEDLPSEIQGGSKISAVIPETSYSDIFDLPVMVFCQLVADMATHEINDWLEKFSDYGHEAANKAKQKIDNWNREWAKGLLKFPDLQLRIQEGIDQAISKLSTLRRERDSKLTDEAQPVTIKGKTYKGSVKAVLHEIEKEYGWDREKTAAALKIGSDRLKKALEEKSNLTTDKDASQKLERFPDEEIKRLLEETIAYFVVDPLSRREWGEKSSDEKIQTVHIALKVTSKRLAGDHGSICFGGMTFEQIEKEICYRAAYLYEDVHKAVAALDIDIRKFQQHWPPDQKFPSRYTLFSD